jgi:hypothetical protein
MSKNEEEERNIGEWPEQTDTGPTMLSMTQAQDAGMHRPHDLEAHRTVGAFVGQSY